MMKEFAAMRWPIIMFLLLVVSSLSGRASAQDRTWSVSAGASYTSASELYFDPDNPDDFLRSLSYSLNDVFGYGIDVRKELPDLGIQLGLSTEVLKRREAVAIPNGNGTAEAHDGFVAIPIELTGYFRIPFSTETWEVLMGGGGALYYGTRYHDEAGVSAETIDRSMGAGIQVVGELQYNVNSTVGLRFDMKFRNVHFRTVNRFAVPYGTSNGSTVALDQAAFASIINIDGMLLGLHLAVRF